jgi:hypothetical protein
VKDYLRILDLASRDALPDRINDHSDPPFAIVRELVEAGYLWAIDASSFDGDEYMSPRITLQGREYLAHLQGQMQESERYLIANIDRLRSTLVSVSTGGPKIDDVNASYKEMFMEVDVALGRRGIANPIPFHDLWDWHGRWSRGDLPKWQDRRDFLAAIFNPLLDRVRAQSPSEPLEHVEPTGWMRVDRALSEIRRRLGEARTEEQYQAVGLLCREVLISLAQAVYDPDKHPSVDDTKPSETDAKRMLDAFLFVELGGSTHEAARRHTKAAYDLSTALQHRRTADFRQAAMCVEAAGSVVNVIAIVSGYRDPP